MIEPNGITDTIRAARQLDDIAQLFQLEATQWRHDAQTVDACLHAIGLLHDCMRMVLRTGDVDRAEAWLYSAELTLAHVQLTRQFRDGKPPAPRVIHPCRTP